MEYELFITRWGNCAPNKVKQMQLDVQALDHSLHFVLSCSGPYPHLTMIFKQLKMEGFMQSRWEHKHPESLKRLMGWLREVSILFIFNVFLEHFLLFMCLLFFCRENCKVGNMSQKALNKCQLLSWVCCVEKTLARLLSQSDLYQQR